MKGNLRNGNCAVALLVEVGKSLHKLLLVVLVLVLAHGLVDWHKLLEGNACL